MPPTVSDPEFAFGVMVGGGGVVGPAWEHESVMVGAGAGNGPPNEPNATLIRPVAVTMKLA
jgi:hypothetical protein